MHHVRQTTQLQYATGVILRVVLLYLVDIVERELFNGQQKRGGQARVTSVDVHAALCRPSHDILVLLGLRHVNIISGRPLGVAVLEQSKDTVACAI